MSGSSLDGLDIAFVELTEVAGQWTYVLEAADCVPYPEDMLLKLQGVRALSIAEFCELHSALGHYFGEQVNKFIQEKELSHRTHFIASHGHTAYHNPAAKSTFQLGDGAAIAATTKLTAISDLRAKDIALGGQGAPIVPIADKLLFSDYDYCLNLGGIANVTINGEYPIAFDICAANQVLNILAQQAGSAYDDGGQMAAGGVVATDIIEQLGQNPYFLIAGAKSLANNFSTEQILPQLEGLSTEDALATAVAHIVGEIARSLSQYDLIDESKMLVTGGGANNTFLMQELRKALPQIVIEEASTELINYKEAIAMALLGALRWREEANVLHSATGAMESSVGGALWVN